MCSIDLRVGGSYHIVFVTPNGTECSFRGTYLEIERPTRLAFTWIWDDEQRETLIEIDFEEADGVTTVHFTHSGLRDEESVRSHEGGWTAALDNLERALAG